MFLDSIPRQCLASTDLTKTMHRPEQMYLKARQPPGRRVSARQEEGIRWKKIVLRGSLHQSTVDRSTLVRCPQSA
jgi:hypothetical protein